jgi:ABC-type multidrug transport system ATPase subunit
MGWRREIVVVGDGGKDAAPRGGNPETKGPTEEVSPRDALVKWANGQDSWVRALVDTVLKASGPLGDTAVSQLYDRYLAEKGLSEETVEVIGPLSGGDAGVTAKSALALESLGEVTGVNALTSGQEIVFNRGLTIIFGENGSGKTGYTRILKALADVRTFEEILPDVNETGAAAPQECLVKYVEDDIADEHRWKGERGVVPFTAISIFDSPAVALHVDDDLNYIYTPGDLALFAVVGKAIDGIHELLDDAIAGRRPKGNPFVSHFTNGTAVYAAVETLGPTTEIEAVEKLALGGEEAKAERDAKQVVVDALRGGAVDAQTAAARTRRDLAAKLAEVATAVDNFQVELYGDTVGELAEAESAYGQIRAAFAAQSGAEGDAEEKWQDFVLAGEEYRHHLVSQGNHDPDHCIYCRQSLDAQAKARLETYREFADDAGRKRVDAAKTAIDRLTRGILAVDLRTAQDALASAREENSEDQGLMDAGRFLEDVDACLVSIRSGVAVPQGEVGKQAVVIKSYGERRRAEEDSLIEALDAKRAERVEKLKEADAELADVVDRIELSARLDAIRSHVEDAKWAAKAEQLSKRFRGISASLTATVKAASAKLLNTDFERRFEEECHALRAPKVGLAFPGRRGEPARRKTVSANHKPSKVLSEGEQKVIGLADFLAEVSLRQSSVPVVFDDPVNSLDYRRIAEVSSRIAALASERQVIIFTHNIWLTVELLAQFESKRDECTYYRVTDEAGKGKIVEGSHPRWDTVKGTKGKINATLQDAKAAEGETREALVERAYSLMRTWSEVVVEEELFAGVLGRFAPNVAMGKLEKVRPERLQAAIDTINPIFEKACRIMEGHSQPLESLGHTPSVEEAEEDWKRLQEARDAYRA